MRIASVASLLLLSACTMSRVVPEATGTEFVPTGEVNAYNRSTAFDEVRVRGPKANLAKRTDGSWGGVLVDRPVDVSVTETHVRGAEMLITREDSLPGKTVITGQFLGRIYRFEITETQAMIRTPSVSLTYPGRLVSVNGVKYGPMGNFELKGVAGAENPPWPQLAFALIAAFN